MNTQLRELSVEGFEEVLGRVAAPLLTLLRRAAVIDGALRKVLSGAAARSSAEGGGDGPDGSESAAAYSERVEKQCAGMVQRVCELAHDRYARLLKTRKEVHARLPLMDFVRMSKSIVEFVHDVQHLSGQPYDALSSELQSHAQAFLQTTHEASMHKLEAIVEIEQWKQARPTVRPSGHRHDSVCPAPCLPVPILNEPRRLSVTCDLSECACTGGRGSRVPGDC